MSSGSGEYAKGNKLGGEMEVGGTGQRRSDGHSEKLTAEEGFSG